MGNTFYHIKLGSVEERFKNDWLAGWLVLGLAGDLEVCHCRLLELSSEVGWFNRRAVKPFWSRSGSIYLEQIPTLW